MTSIPNFASGKRNLDAWDIADINKHLADKGEKHMGEDEKLVTATKIHLDVSHEKEEEIYNMLRKHERIWFSQPGEIKETEM